MPTTNVFAYSPYSVGSIDVKTDINFATPGTTLVTAYTLRIPAGVLTSVGDRLIVTFFANLLNAANTKHIRVFFGGAEVFTVSTAGNTGPTVFDLTLVRNAVSTTPLTAIRGTTFSGAIVGCNWTNHNIDMSSAQDLEVKLETPGAAGDVTLTDVIVDAITKV